MKSLLNIIKMYLLPPAVGDEGQAIGAYQHADYTQNNNIHKSKTFAGKEYDYIGDEKLTIKK